MLFEFRPFGDIDRHAKTVQVLAARPADGVEKQFAKKRRAIPADVLLADLITVAQPRINIIDERFLLQPGYRMRDIF